MAFDIVEADAGSGGAQFAFDEFEDTDTVNKIMPYTALAYGSLNGPYTVVNTTDRFPVAAAQNGTWNITNISGTISLPTNAATATLQSTANASLASIDGKITAVNTGAVVIASSVLPAGASTSAKQDTIIGHLDGVETLLTSLDAKVPALGQALAAASVPVVLTAAQLTTLTPPAAITGFALESTLSALNSKVTAVDTGAVVVSSSVLPAGAATSAKQDTLIGHVDGIETLLAGTLTVTGPLTDVQLRATPVPVSGSVTGTVTADTELTTDDLDTGAGTDTRAVVGLVLAASGGGVLVGAANPMPISDNGGSITIDGSVSVSGNVTIIDGGGSITVDGTVTANQGGTWNIATLTSITDVVHVDDNGSTLSIDDGGGSITVDGAVTVSGSITADTELTTADLDTGAGTDTRAVVGLVGSASGGGQLIPGSSTDGLLVNLGVNNDVTVTGSVTANAGTNLNTSLLALEAGGNLEDAVDLLTTIDADTSILAGIDYATGADVAALLVVGGGAEATALRVTIANDSTGVLSIDDNGGSITVDGTVSISGTVTVASHAVTNAGTFVVQENGPALTALQLLDDTVATLGTTTYTEASTKGLVISAVRRDADTTMVDTTNEMGPLQMNAVGQLKVEVFSGETLPVSLTSVPTHAVTQSGTWNVGTLTTITDVVHVDDNGSTLSIDDGGSSITVDGTVSISGTVTVGSHAVTNAGTFAVQVDGAALTSLQLLDDCIYADDADWMDDTSKHALVGGLYQSTPQTITDGDVGPFQVTANGYLIVSVNGTVTVATHAVTQSGTWNVGTVTTITNVVHIDDNGSTISIDDGGGSITIDGTVAVSGTVTVASHAVTNAGTFVVQENGAALTALQLIDDVVYAEDVAAQAGDKGIAILAVRRDADTTLVGADNDYANLQVDANGYLKVEIFDGGGSHTIDDGGSSITVDGTVSVSGTVTVGSHAVTNAGTFAVQVDGAALTALQLIDDAVYAEDVAAQAGDKGLAILAVRRDADTTLVGADNDYANLQVNAAGQLKVEAFSGETLPVSLVSVPSHAVTNAGTFAVQETKPSAGTLANVATSTTSATLIASNASRKGAIIHNDSTATLYVKLGATASATSYSYKLASGQHLELPHPVYTGVIDGILSTGTGTARVTELT